MNDGLLAEQKKVGADFARWLRQGGGLALKAAIADPAGLRQAVREADLRGLGGSGFPVWRKWDAVAAEASRPDKYLVVNGNEDEPGTFKDRLLLETTPHQVIEGALAAALAVGANRVVLYVNPDLGRCLETLTLAIRQWRDADALREPSRALGRPLDLLLVESSGHYIGGEETAALSWIEGALASPADAADGRKVAFGDGACSDAASNAAAEYLDRQRHEPPGAASSGAATSCGAGSGAGSGAARGEPVLAAAADRRPPPFPAAFPFPRGKPPYPAQFGVFGCPTLINNVETLAQAGEIARHGAAAFRARGCGDSAGSKLYSLSGDILHPGVYELPMGTPLRELIYQHGGGLLSGKPLKAVFTGGPSNTLLTPADLDVALDFDSLRARGGSLGTGAMIVVSEGTGMVKRVAEYVRFFAHSSCGQCPSCKTGTATLSRLLDRIDTGRGTAADLATLETVYRLLPGSGRCHLVSGVTQLLDSAFRHFHGEFRQALRG